MEKLVQRRAVIRTSTTNLIKRIKQKLTEKSEVEIDILLKQFSQKDEKLDELNDQIMDLIEGDEVEKELLKCEEYKDAITEYKVKARRMLQRHHSINKTND